MPQRDGYHRTTGGAAETDAAAGIRGIMISTEIVRWLVVRFPGFWKMAGQAFVRLASTGGKARLQVTN
jgi:hypothetical protein